MLHTVKVGAKSVESYRTLANGLTKLYVGVRTKQIKKERAYRVVLKTYIFEWIGWD